MHLLEKIKTTPEEVSFTEVIDYIDEHYHFTPTPFKNGACLNEENQNNGSCKIFSFAQLNQFSEEQTLHLFGDYYRKDVLGSPDGTDHQNIRNFMKFGWDGIAFSGKALKSK